MVIGQDLSTEIDNLTNKVEDLIRIVATRALDADNGVLAEVEAAAGTTLSLKTAFVTGFVAATEETGRGVRSDESCDGR